MTDEPAAKDLVVLAADGQIGAALDGLLCRAKSLRFREVVSNIFVHPQKDPGCFFRGHDFLRPFCRQYRFALVVFDREGCGRQQLSREVLETEIEQRLAVSGWGNRAAAVAIDPELEAWVWSDSPEVDQVLGWSNRTPSLSVWLKSEGFRTEDEAKPRQPKRALEEALQLARKRRSSSIYRQLAERVGVHRCTDPAFLKLKTVLQSWFGAAAVS
jgi:hypothetical protein